jgi:hypothetical protein
MATHWKRPKKNGKATTKPLGQPTGSGKFKDGINVEDFSRLENEGGAGGKVTPTRFVPGKE